MRRTDAGMVTAETAMALPALVLVLGFLLTAQSVLGAQATCADAARAAARAAARGEPDAVVLATARQVSSSSSRVTISRRSGLVTVAVTVQPAGVVTRLNLPEVSAQAVSADESAASGGLRTGDTAGVSPGITPQGP